MPQSTRTHTHYLEVCLHALSPAHKVLPAAGTHPAYLRLEAAASAEEVARLALHDPSPGHRTRSLSLENSPRPPLDILLARPSMFQVTMRPLITPDCSATSVETNLFFERNRISNLIRHPEIFRIRIRILFVVRKFSNPNPNIRGSGKKIRIRIRI